MASPQAVGHGPMSKKSSSTLIVVGALIAAAALGSGKSSSTTSSKHVSVWGDSLTVNAQSALETRGATVHAKGGTAPCDWLPGFEQTLVADHPSHVELAFVGNVSKPCMGQIRTTTQLEMHDPDLLIRTSGELRTSNFLLWQCAYSELVFRDELWPDFGRTDLLHALLDYQKRDRRFGGLNDTAIAAPDAPHEDDFAEEIALSS